MGVSFGVLIAGAAADNCSSSLPDLPVLQAGARTRGYGTASAFDGVVEIAGPLSLGTDSFASYANDVRRSAELWSDLVNGARGMCVLIRPPAPCR
jgi:hypothetical protein